VISAVFDCGVLLSAIGWKGNPRRCLSLVAHRQVRFCATSETWNEYETRIAAVLAKKHPGVNPQATLDWLLTVAHFVNPAPLGKPRSRDLKDDRYLACALGAGAKFIVSNDRDLLDLEKPFGVQIVTPVQLLLHIRGKAGL
jgi:putative PIN family toxin of toxin-antitoxin system